jgi:hypothetical protein
MLGFGGGGAAAVGWAAVFCSGVRRLLAVRWAGLSGWEGAASVKSEECVR